MPSIEIACIDQGEVSALPEFLFAVAAERGLRSHRVPRPLWQADFDAQNGCMYHLGNTDLRGDRGKRTFFAYELLSERSRNQESDVFELDASYRSGVEDLLSRLQDASPTRRLLFTSDWQFGPKVGTRGTFESLADFWRAHDDLRLRLNGLYRLGAWPM